jgi:integrase
MHCLALMTYIAVSTSVGSKNADEALRGHYSSSSGLPARRQLDPSSFATSGQRGGQLKGHNRRCGWAEPHPQVVPTAAPQRRAAAHPPSRPPHSYASIALARGVHPKVVQETLGHTSIAVTLDLYSHVVPTLQRDAAREMGAALLG